jgi:type I restriction enzyme, S subunit
MSDQYSARTPESYSVWPLDRIKDHASKIGSGVTPTGGAASYLDSGVPLLRSQNVHFNGIRLDDVAFVSEDTHAGMAGSQVRSGDVLLNITGASIGRCATVPKGFGEANVNQHVCIIRPTAKLQPSFLHYCLSAPWGQDQILSLFTGASRQGLGQRDLGAMLIPLPPLAEQRLIVAFLDRGSKAIDRAIADKREQLVLLDAVKRDAIQTAVTRGVGTHPALRATANTWIAEVPENWELVSLKRVADIHSGLTLGKDYDGPVVERPYLRVANVQDGHLDLAEVTTIEVPLAVAHRLTLRVGDVLMTEGGDLDKLGRGTLWNGEIPDCLHQNHIFSVRCFAHKLVPAFLAYLTASQYGRDYFEATGKKTTNLAATNSTKVGQFPIPLPPVAEQRAICAYLDDKLGHLRQVADCIRGQIDLLTDYRKSLIHEYVTGQRRVPFTQEEKAVAYG